MRYSSALWLLLFALFACDSSTAPKNEQKPENELQFVRFPVDLAPLAETSASFWAVKGQNRQLVLRYRTSSGPGSDEFMRFEVPANALLRRPDGSLIQLGDSVLITVQLGSDRRLLFDFQPSGLRFNTFEPARLRINFRRLLGDLDGNGMVNDADSELERLMRIWKQEQPGEPWFPLGTIRDLDDDEVRANVTSFTGFVIAA